MKEKKKFLFKITSRTNETLLEGELIMSPEDLMGHKAKLESAYHHDRVEFISEETKK